MLTVTTGDKLTAIRRGWYLAAARGLGVRSHRYIVNVRASNAEGTGFASAAVDATPEAVTGTAT